MKVHSERVGFLFLSKHKQVEPIAGSNYCAYEAAYVRSKGSYPHPTPIYGRSIVDILGALGTETELDEIALVQDLT